MRTLMIAALTRVASCAVACTGNQEPAARSTSTTTVSTPSTVDKPTSSEASGLAGCVDPGWGTGPKEAAGSSLEALYLVRARQHECFDRVVFDVNGSAEVGYRVRYVPVVRADGSGNPFRCRGSAALEVVVRAPAQGFDNSGHQPGKFLAQPRDYLYTSDQLAGWQSLRAVRFAGSFEGQSTFAVGVAETLPFKVSTQLDEATRHVVVDIAHPLSK
jgi:hypothetical protein